MDTHVVFDRISIEDFRGFQTQQLLELDASATIVVGPNGTGKTSFFDAIQWLLIGDIPRLKDRANRRSEDYIVNSWSKKRIARVSAELRVGDQRFQIVRTGDASKTTFELHDSEGSFEGPAAQAQLKHLFLLDDGFSLQEAVTTTGMLQQDALLAVIEEDPKQRYAHLARLLGLEEMQEYEKTARQSADSRRLNAKALSEKLERATRELQQAQTELEDLSDQVIHAPSMQRLQSDLEAVFERHAQVLERHGDLTLDVDSMSRLGTAARRIRERSEDLVSRNRILDSRPRSFPKRLQDDVDEIDTRIAVLLGELQQAETDFSAAEAELSAAESHTKSLADLAFLALPLVNTRCPVCGQEINPETVRSHLQSVLDSEDPRLRTLRLGVEHARDRRDSIKQEWQQESGRRDALTLQQAQVDRQMQEWAASYAALTLGVDILRPVNLDNVTAVDQSTLDAIRQAAIDIEQASRETASALAIPEIARRYESQRLRVLELNTLIETLRTEVTAANREAKEARALVHATTEGITNLTKRRFEQLLPLIREIYSRLDPHPAFTLLDYDLDVYYKRSVADPVVIDEELGVRADPLLVFSSSQANVAALTFFLALGWSAGSHSLPFLFLDDPLQAMDDINALGFADLCRHIRSARQLVVSTHDRRLGYLLERKLAPRAEGERTRVLRFGGWDRTGPQIEQYDVESQVEEAERRILQEAA